MGQTAAKAVKIPCVKCNRPVGTQFLIKDDKYIAACGDTKNPCNLDIKIYNGIFTLYQEFIQDYKYTIEIINRYLEYKLFFYLFYCKRLLSFYLKNHL